MDIGWYTSGKYKKYAVRGWTVKNIAFFIDLIYGPSPKQKKTLRPKAFLVATMTY